MSRRFLIKDIALQAGVGTATVDRVLNGRGGVRHQTEQRIRHAIEELERQQKAMAIQGRKFIIDTLVEAPDEFGWSLKNAVDAELPLLRPVVFRMRSDIRPHFPVSEIQRSLARIRRRGSHGVILMAPDSQPIRDEIARLAEARIPVVTFATDIPGSQRCGYVGPNNRQAGETAAFLLRGWLPCRDPHILITIRNNRFRGEEDRELGFRAAIRRHFRLPRFTELIEDPSGNRTVGQLLRETVHAMPDLDAVYSVGGGNRQILDIFREVGRSAGVFIAHDLYAENRQLLAEWKIDAVLDHDFRQDIRGACQILMACHGVIANEGPHPTSQMRIIVPPMLADYPPDRH